MGTRPGLTGSSVLRSLLFCASLRTADELSDFPAMLACQVHDTMLCVLVNEVLQKSPECPWRAKEAAAPVAESNNEHAEVEILKVFHRQNGLIGGSPCLSGEVAFAVS